MSQVLIILAVFTLRMKKHLLWCCFMVTEATVSYIIKLTNSFQHISTFIFWTCPKCGLFQAMKSTNLKSRNKPWSFSRKRLKFGEKEEELKKSSSWLAMALEAILLVFTPLNMNKTSTNWSLYLL